MNKRIIQVAVLVLSLSICTLANINLGFKLVLGGSVLPTISLGYEHDSGHGIEITTGILPGGKYKFLLRGELGYTYRYKNLKVGIGRGITRYGAESIPVFDDHFKMSYLIPRKNQSFIDIGSTVSLGVSSQGIAFWGGINKQYNL